MAFMSLVTLGMAAAALVYAFIFDGVAFALFSLLIAGLWHVVFAPLVRFLVRGGLGGSGRFHYRVTRSGAMACVVTGIFYLLSVRWGANVAYMATALLGAVLLWSVLHPRLMLSGTTVEAQPPERIFAGAPFALDVKVRNRRRGLGAFGLTISAEGDAPEARQHFVRLPAGAERRCHVRCGLSRRGWQRLPAPVLSSSFPFGLFEARMQAPDGREALVLPPLGQIQGEGVRLYSGGEAKWLLQRRRKDQQGDFRSLREYRDGDNPRHIHWVTTARLGDVYVREFERREMQSVLLLLDAHAPPESAEQAVGRRERFETAVSFCATLATLLTQGSVPYSFASWSDQFRLIPYGTSAEHLADVLEALALAQMDARYHPERLIEAARNRVGRTVGACLVSPGPVASGLRVSLADTGARNTVVMDVAEPEFNALFSVES